jgi:hypothetical protein
VTDNTNISREEFELLVKLAGNLFEDARASADAGLWRPAVILVGTSLEAALLATACCLEQELRASGAWPKTKRSPREWGLRELIPLASLARWLPSTIEEPGATPDPSGLLAGDVGDAMAFVQRLRNALAHPGRHIGDLSWLNVADDTVMKPTYELCEGIAGEVFDRLRQAIGA